MSFQAGSNCVDTAQEASTFYAMAQAGQIVTLNGASYSASIISVYPTFHVIKYTNVADGTAIWSSPAFAAQTCIQTSNPFVLSLEDASLLVSAILAVWALGYAFKLVRKSLGDNSPE